MKIAICDDELYFRERIKKIIAAYMGEKGFQYSIDCFESGVEFLKSGYQKTAYEIIFLDINMKEIDGIETAKAIRNGMPGTYIVFVTAYVVIHWKDTD